MAFYCCTKLKSITIPDSVTEIETSAFFDCKKLRNDIVEKIMKINEKAFNDNLY